MTADQKSIRRLPRTSVGGFTLIELLTVLVIVAVLAGVAVPTLNTMSGSRSSMAARQLLRDLTFARQRAIATGTTSWVVFNTPLSRWTVMAENPLAPGRAGATAISDLATGRTYVISLNTGDFVGVTITGCNFDAATEIGFNWLGKPLNSTSANLAANGTVNLSGGVQITVYRGTGHVEQTLP